MATERLSGVGMKRVGLMGFLDRLRGRDNVVAQRTEVTAGYVPGQPHFAVVDVETTGLSAQSHRVVEVAVVTTDPWGRVLDEWSTRINPQGPVGATHIHGITDADVANAPVFADVIAQLNQRLAGAAVAAHHATFDLAFLRAEYRRAGWEMPHLPALCTLEASDYHLPMLDRRRLADCCWAVGRPLTGAHSALGDARATAMLLAAYMHPHVGKPPLPQHLSLPTEALSVPWPAGPTLAPQPSAPTAPGLRPPPPTRVRATLAEAAEAGPAAALVELVERFSLVDALDEGAPAGALAYLEKLAEVLEDGEVTTEEAADLDAVAAAENLQGGDISAANQAFVLALAHAALEDGKVSRDERTELLAIAELLGVSAKVVPTLLDRAEHARNERLGADLGELPAVWPHGEPLRVGDKVVFTGCDDQVRTELEARSEALGVRIIGGVSAKVAMLVTDGSMDGGKAAKARELGTRTVHPDQYALLLQYLQPALPRDIRVLPKTRGQAAPIDESVTGGSATNGSDATGDSIPNAPSPNPALVRQWARAAGYEVGVRGRLHKDVLDAYIAAHPGGA